MDQVSPIEINRRRQSLNAKIRQAAKQRQVHPDLIRHQYVFALFFKLLFADDSLGWCLLGGNALLIRTAGGSFTKDVDLARPSQWASSDEVLRELEGALVPSDDPMEINFSVRRVFSGSFVDSFGYGSETLKAIIDAHLRGALYHHFEVDITTQRHVQGPVDYLQLEPVFSDESLENLPRIPLIPIENHLADKLCAMYELHGQTRTASTRYRDLADLVRIIKVLPLDAERIAQLFSHESQRRKISLPQAVQSSSPLWEQAFPRAAASYSDYPVDLRPLEASLLLVARCLNEILDGSRNSGSWNPTTQNWE